jgi:hypothetical protein
MPPELKLSCEYKEEMPIRPAATTPLQNYNKMSKNPLILIGRGFHVALFLRNCFPIG